MSAADMRGDPHTSDRDPESLLAPLDPEQREVALALRGPVRVLAGAGTGKTRALTHRIAYGVATGVYNPQQVLAVTFTTRAAGEMRSRLRALGAVGVQARTFHSAALRQARYFWPRVYGVGLPELVESKLGMVGQAARRNRLDTSPATLRDLAGEIEWSKVSNVRPEDYEGVAASRGREVGVAAAEVARVFASYEEVKRAAGRMDMEDVLLCAAAVISEDERVAAEVRRQYHHFVVDEFQDVSPIQVALLDLWLGGRHDLCVVGDPSQTIYSFAGASAQHLLDFPRRHPGTTSVELVRNYRSTPQVVEVANEVIGATRPGSSAVRLRATRQRGPAVGFVEHPDEVSEAVHVAARVRALVDEGTPAGEVAVLVRVNAQSEAFEDAFAGEAVPYVVRGAERFFMRPEVRQAVALVRAGARTDEGATVSRDALVSHVQDVLAGAGWTPQPPTSRGSQRDRWESLQALVGLARTYVSEHPEAEVGVVTGFAADLERRAAEQHAPAAEGVTIATLHAAKGLEWEHVFLCGAHEGALPISHAMDSPAAIEEERRLCYVGVTRARDSLTVSWARARNPGGRGSRKLSRFFDSVSAAPSQPTASSSGRGNKKKAKAATCRVCGARLFDVPARRLGRCTDCPSSYDEELFDRLREWRRERADHDSVPAYVVFTDATLQAIAEVRPTTEQQLLAINGIGASKRDKYADDVLGLVRAIGPDFDPAR
jgi:DNA helicase II / ATP-dependent DNA helicase PcrA